MFEQPFNFVKRVKHGHASNKMDEAALEGEATTLIINQLVTACALNGFIEPVWISWRTSSSRQMARTWSGRIRMAPRGRRLCKHQQADGTSYCSKAPSYKH